MNLTCLNSSNFRTMKTIISTFLLIITSFAHGQVVPPLQQRGMYISKFIKFQDINASPTSLIVDPNRSILGVDIDGDGIYEKEVALIAYCKQNHITSITLYDCGIPLAYLSSRYPGDPLNHTFAHHLCRFINYCRANCIDKIGIAGGGTAFFDNASIFSDQANASIRLPQTPVFQFPSYLIGSTLASELDFVTHNYDRSDPMFETSEYLKVMLRTALLPQLSPCTAYVDVLNLEYEFWNTNTGNPVDLYPTFRDLLD